MSYANASWDGTKRTHLVVAPTTTGKMSTMFSGSAYQCRRFIRIRVRNNLPTHFCYVVTNTIRAVERLAGKVVG